MILRVDATSPVPPYEQIRSQVATMITTGVVTNGARLPSIRQLAKDLGLAGGTVARAYRELESDGLIRTRGRHGTFVIASGVVRGPSQEAALAETARAFAVRARQLGADTQSGLDAARRAFEALQAGAPEG